MAAPNRFMECGATSRVHGFNVDAYHVNEVLYNIQVIPSTRKVQEKLLVYIQIKGRAGNVGLGLFHEMLHNLQVPHAEWHS
jgi:hypothetical protein